MSEFSEAQLVVNRYGVCKKVIVDGHSIPNVIEARVILKPEEPARLVVEIFLCNVKTIREDA